MFFHGHRFSIHQKKIPHNKALSFSASVFKLSYAPQAQTTPPIKAIVNIQ